MSTIFEGWIPVTDGFGYSGEGASLTYSGKWAAPYTATTLTQARSLIDFKYRFAAAATATTGDPDPDYSFKEQIEHSLVPMLTAQRFSILPNNDFAPNSMDSVTGNSADGLWHGNDNAKNTIDNPATCVVTIEWMLKPVNSWGVNCAFMSVNGTGEFQEMGANRVGYCLQDTRTGTGNPKDIPGKDGISVVTGATPTSYTAWDYVVLNPLEKGHPIIEPRDVITIEYPWVDAALVNQGRMRGLRGKINLHDISIYPAGTLLYEGSDVESSVSPLGNLGFRVTHHFVAKDKDFNLVPIAPAAVPSGSTDWGKLAWGWATIRPPMVEHEEATGTQPKGQYPSLSLDNKYSSWRNRVYQYADFWASGVPDLFFYGFAPDAPTAFPAVNPYA